MIASSGKSMGLYPGAETPDQPDEVVVVDAGDVAYGVRVRWIADGLPGVEALLPRAKQLIQRAN
jgi:hypothetical protein